MSTPGGTPGPALGPVHEQILTGRGIPPAAALAAGVRAALVPADLPEDCPPYWAEWLPALLFPWRAEDGRTEWQIRPDTPPLDKTGRPIKYATRSREDGYAPVLWVARRGAADGPRLLVEGTCQTLAAATWAPPGVWVVGLVGCRGWMSDGQPVVDLGMFTGHEVLVALDADVSTNRDVWDAGGQLQRALRAEGARAVRWLRLPAGRRAGLDDVLARRPPERRTDYLNRLLADAEAEKFPDSRRPKRTEDPDGFFGENGLRVQALSAAVFARRPSALTREDRVALYVDGAYRPDGVALTGIVVDLLGDDFRPAHRDAVEEFTRGVLYNTNRRLPDRVTEPLLNVANGMLDLPTATLKPHDPAYLSAVQFPVPWEPEARCPAYEEWLAEVVGEQAADLEESAAAMLDPSTTPAKAVFLYGPPRSGKSTFLRLMQAVAGQENTSGVSLAQLAENRFAAASVYGRALNVSADLSASEVQDLSLFKLMTGEDLITADRKFGRLFTFVNRALFAFSANELPTVAESSRAYTERIKPFKFGRSFAGREDPRVEEALRHELPGILARWVRAWQRRTARGSYLLTDPAVQEEFEVGSDRVRQWAAEELQLHPLGPAGELVTVNYGLPETHATGRRDLARMFTTWAKESGSAPLGERKVLARLETLPGVVPVRIGTTRRPGLNLTRRPGGDPWPGGEGPAPESVQSHAPSSTGDSATHVSHCASTDGDSTPVEAFEGDVGDFQSLDVGSRVRESDSLEGSAGDFARPSGDFAGTVEGSSNLTHTSSDLFFYPSTTSLEDMEGKVERSKGEREEEKEGVKSLPPRGSNSGGSKASTSSGSSDPTPAEEPAAPAKVSGRAAYVPPALPVLPAGPPVEPPTWPRRGSVHELTAPGGGPLATLLDLAEDYTPDRCPDCHGPMSPVPPAGFWYACAVCHPKTFGRGRPDTFRSRTE